MRAQIGEQLFLLLLGQFVRLLRERLGAADELLVVKIQFQIAGRYVVDDIGLRGDGDFVKDSSCFARAPHDPPQYFDELVILACRVFVMHPLECRAMIVWFEVQETKQTE